MITITTQRNKLNKQIVLQKKEDRYLLLPVLLVFVGFRVITKVKGQQLSILKPTGNC